MAPKPNFGSRDSYTRTAIALHWLIALLIVCGFALGWVMTDIPGFTPAKLRYFSWHKWIGVTVFGLSVLRILWRATHDAPPLPRRISSWQRGAAHLVHLLLYVLIIAIPVSGYLYSSAANVPVVYLGLVPLLVIKTMVMIAMRSSGTLRPAISSANTLLGSGQVAVVDMRTFM